MQIKLKHREMWMWGSGWVSGLVGCVFSKLYLLLTPCNRFLVEKLTVCQLVKKFPAFYGTHHLSLFWARSIQYMPLLATFWRFILILSSHMGLHLPSGLFPSSPPPQKKTCKHLCSSPKWYVPRLLNYNCIKLPRVRIGKSIGQPQILFSPSTHATRYTLYALVTTGHPQALNTRYLKLKIKYIYRNCEIPHTAQVMKVTISLKVFGISCSVLWFSLHFKCYM